MSPFIQIRDKIQDQCSITGGAATPNDNEGKRSLNICVFVFLYLCNCIFVFVYLRKD